MQEDLLQQWTMAVAAQAAEGNETRGLLCGGPNGHGSTSGRTHNPPPPPNLLLTKTEYVVGEWDLKEAIKRGREMGGWWLGWVHTHPTHGARC